MRQDTKVLFTLYYHNIFEYPLTAEELNSWRSGKKFGGFKKTAKIGEQDGFFFLKGKGFLISERKRREKVSRKKVEFAKRSAEVISVIPTVKMIGLTGALAMANARESSDIDLFIICRKRALWITRAMVVCLLGILGIPRNAGGRVEKDHLCLNMWLDETDLVWDRKDRNFYTAHEIAQIKPLINKSGTFEKFIRLNRWIGDFWPNAIDNRNPKFDPVAGYLFRNKSKLKIIKYLSIVSDFVLRASNFVSFRLQYLYMKHRITREVVTPTRAIFHPRDWGKIVESELTS